MFKGSKLLSFCVVLFFLIFLVSGCTPKSNENQGSNDFYSTIIQAEKNYIISLQVESGAIKMANGPARYTEDGKAVYNVHPYFNNLAVIGLLEESSIESINTAKKWINWYLDHLNNPDYNGLSGTIYDYEYVEGGTENPKNYYDSVDSYAATFLSLLKKYYEVSNDSSLLLNNRDKIEMIADVIGRVQDTDGLTFAKPDYQIKFLMDNVEVYDGLSAIEFIERNVFGDKTKADYYRAMKEAVANAIESKLWNSNANSYYPYYGSPDANWNVFYPDATSQLFPIGFGLLNPTSDRAKYLYNKFNESIPGWTNLNTGDAFPWAFLAYVAALMGDKARVDTYLNEVNTRYITNNHPWTWYIAEAGWTIRAAKYVRDNLK
jgi:hypothetical protein